MFFVLWLSCHCTPSMVLGALERDARWVAHNGGDHDRHVALLARCFPGFPRRAVLRRHNIPMAIAISVHEESFAHRIFFPEQSLLCPTCSPQNMHRPSFVYLGMTTNCGSNFSCLGAMSCVSNRPRISRSVESCASSICLIALQTFALTPKMWPTWSGSTPSRRDCLTRSYSVIDSSCCTLLQATRASARFIDLTSQSGRCCWFISTSAAGFY